MTDTILLQAPKGGAESRVNGQWYEGGQFMPETGEFCGARKQAKRFAKSLQKYKNISEVVVSRGWVTFFYVGESRARYATTKPFGSASEAVAFAKEMIAARSEWYTNNGFAPHPTLLTIK